MKLSECRLNLNEAQMCYMLKDLLCLRDGMEFMLMGRSTRLTIKFEGDIQSVRQLLAKWLEDRVGVEPP